METLFGFAMFIAQIIAIVKIFGGLKDTPKWLDITVGILLVFFMLSALVLGMEA